MTRTLTAPALLRILEAVGGWPANQKPSDLRRQLLRAIHEYDWGRSLHPNIKAQQARLRAIHKCASELAGLLTVDEEKNGVFKGALWPEDAPSPSKIVTEIAEVIEAKGWLKESARKIVAEVKADGVGSAFEWLVGTELPAVFKDFFRNKPTVSRNGEYSRFAKQVLIEFGITNRGQQYSREAIIRALTSARSGRRRGGQK